MNVVTVRAEITGIVMVVTAPLGTTVRAGDELLIMESMKMEIPVVAPIAGVVSSVLVGPSQPVNDGDPVVTIDPHP